MFWSIFWIVYIWFAICAFIALNSARKIDRLIYRSFGLADCVLWAVLWQSEDDDRRYKNLELWEQESLEECLRRRLKDYITELAEEEI